MSQNNFYSEPPGSPAAASVTSLSGQNPNAEILSALQQLNNRLEFLEFSLPERSAQIPSVPSSSAPLPKVSLPEKFSGTIGKCRDFLISVENIFALQSSRYSTDQIRTRFIGTLLSQEALGWFRDVVENKSYLLNDYGQFISEFKALFEDPNAARYARSVIKRLKQGQSSVTSYAMKFRRYASETGYNEVALLDIFREGLNTEVRKTMSAVPKEPETLDEYINLVAKIDQRQFDFRMEQRRQSFDSRPSTGFKSSPMQMRGRPPVPFKYIPKNVVPMDLDAVYTTDQKGFRHLTVEEKKRRKDLNLCVYCGDAGHDLMVCPKRSSKKDLNFLEIATVRFQDKLSDSSIFAPTILTSKGKQVNLYALLDSGANSNFVSSKIVEENSLLPVKLGESITVKMADGRTSIIDSYLPLVNVYTEGKDSSANAVIDLLIVNELKYPVILGIPWLRVVNPNIDWSDKSYRFSETTQGELLSKERSSNFCHTSNDRKVVETLSMKTGLELPAGVPTEYSEYAQAFYENELSKLPPTRSFDLEINLKNPQRDPPFMKIYSLSSKEEVILKDWINKNLNAGLIRPSKSPAAAPIFFVPKKDGSLRPCIDYRLLNENSIRDNHPLPLISDVFTKFSNSKIFSKLDLQGAYNLVRIKEGDEWKCAFRCKFGHFEPLVVQFGLTNAPATFQRFVNSIFPDLIDIHIVCYQDDILIFSNDLETHIKIIKEVLKRVIENQLVLKASKCLFHTDSLTFLGHTISTEGIKMELDKVKAIDDFCPPTCVKQLRSFLGLANYYRRFIPNFSDLVLPLTNMTRKNSIFDWDENCQNSFKKVKDYIKNGAILNHPDTSKPFYLFTDASDNALGSVLTQLVEGVYRPIEFFSRKFGQSELNYSVYDKELLAIVESFKNWRHFLIHSTEEVQVFCDHNNLKFFRTTQLLKPRHARWAEFLSEFSFKISHIPGKDNSVADALSRSFNLQANDSNEIQLIPDSKWDTANIDNLTVSTMLLLLPTQVSHDWPEDIARMLESADNQWTCQEHDYAKY